MTFLWIAMGGALGALARYAFGTLLSFPFGTLAVNILGCFVIGALFPQSLSPKAHDFLIIGVLGGFTTFSTFSLDVFKLVDSGAHFGAGLYVIASLFLSLGAVVLGAMIGRWFL